MTHEKSVRYFVDLDGVPDGFPTHRHEVAFWESLGRAVATFGFLEEVLGKAIFSFTATRPYHDPTMGQRFNRPTPSGFLSWSAHSLIL
jgi:hypothetical protein